MASNNRGFTFRSFAENADRLVKLHKAQKKYIKLKEQEAEKKGLPKPKLQAFNLGKALNRLKHRITKYFGSTNFRKPHQSKRECARRLRVYSPAWHSAVNSVKCGHGSKVTV